MYSYLFLWVFTVYNGTFTPIQVGKNIRIEGNCYDLKDANGLKVKVYALSKNEKTYITESKQNGVFYSFDAYISDSTKFLSFECPNYHAITVPVHFIGKLSSKTKFMISQPMVSRDSTPISAGNQVVLCVNAPAAFQYEMKLPNNSKNKGGTYYIRPLS